MPVTIPLEIAKSPMRAIRDKCLDCSGGSVAEVKGCVVRRCPLHPFRLGKNPNRKPMSDERRAKCAERLAAAKAKTSPPPPQ